MEIHSRVFQGSRVKVLYDRWLFHNVIFVGDYRAANNKYNFKDREHALW